MVKISVENIVATTSIAEALDLNALAKVLEGAEYDKKKFPGLIYHLKKPKTATLLFASGKAVCTGAKTITDAEKAINIISAQLKDLGFVVTEKPLVQVQNIVATGDLGREINLNTVAISLGLEHVEYEPEQFPGLVYRIYEPRVVALLFCSGKVVFTGADTVKKVEKAFDIISNELSATGLL